MVKIWTSTVKANTKTSSIVIDAGLHQLVSGATVISSGIISALVKNLTSYDQGLKLNLLVNQQKKLEQNLNSQVLN